MNGDADRVAEGLDMAHTEAASILDSKNIYAFNPAFDKCKDCDDMPDCGCNN